MERLEIYNEQKGKSYDIDLKTDNSVSLQLKSNIFSAIDKITLNHSFTITAPDTLQNRSAFGVGNQVAADSDAVRTKFPCKFYRNGVLLFNGTCHIQSIESGSFSLLLVWGLDCLEALKDGDLSDLTELGNMTFNEVDSTRGKPVPYYNTYAECMELIMFHAHSNGDFAEKNKYGLKASDQFTPCIAARTLFKKCLESAGIAYEVDEDAFEFMKRLAIPLPTLDTGELEIAVNGSGTKGEDKDTKIGNTSFYDGAFFITGFSTDVSNVTVVDGSRFTVASACNLKLSYKVVFGADELLGLSRIRLCVVEYDDEGKESSREYKWPQNTRLGMENGGLVYYMDDVELDFSGKGEFYFVVLGSTSYLNRLEVEKMVVEFNEPPITAGMELSIAANLPKLSKINYVKALCQICGIFPIPPLDGSNVVRFVTPGCLEANKANAVDWSGFVDGEAKKISFAFSDFAQKNLITYKDGEDYAASFPMESPTADKEKTAIELPFMHLSGGRWPLWSVEYDEDEKAYEWSRESVDPAIYYIRPADMSENADAYLSFDELTPAMILKRWQPLADAVKRAKVIQVELLLPQVAVKYIDYSVPVYIEQFGGYFGIISLNSSGSKTTAELIKI